MAGPNHRSRDAAGVVAFVIVLAGGAWGLVVRGERVLHESGGAVFLIVSIVGILILIWVLFVWFWLQGRLRAAAVRRLMPNAVIFDIVTNFILAGTIMGLQRGTGSPVPRFPLRSYITVAVDSNGLHFFGGARAVSRGVLDSAQISSVEVRVADFATRNITRRFPSVVLVLSGGPEVPVLPIRTTLCVPHRLSAARLEALRVDVATALGRPARD